MVVADRSHGQLESDQERYHWWFSVSSINECIHIVIAITRIYRTQTKYTLINHIFPCWMMFSLIVLYRRQDASHLLIVFLHSINQYNRSIDHCPLLLQNILQDWRTIPQDTKRFINMSHRCSRNKLCIKYSSTHVHPHGVEK